MNQNTHTASHTPGPWKVDVEMHTEGEPLTVSTQADFGHDAWTALATVATGNFEYGEANARLIAAAPELLSALTDLLAHHPESGITSYDEGQAWLKARAAITRATGSHATGRE